jgi:hypothetical protein
MVSIKRGKKKESSVPVVTIPQAKVKLVDVEFHPQPRELTTKDGTRTFTVDPGLNAQVVVVDDMDDGTYDGLKFYQNFRMKWNEDAEEWEIREGTALGNLFRAKYGQGFDFESEEDFEFDEDDFENFMYMTKIVPKKNPSTKQEIGSMCHHETIMAIPDPKRKKKGMKKLQPSGPVGDELDLTPEELAEMNKALG